MSQHAGDIDMLFFCLGAMLWYSLLYQSRVVPRLLAVWGLLTVPLVLVATLLLVWDRSLDPSLVLYAPYVPFELTIGLWLLFKGGQRPQSPGRRRTGRRHREGSCDEGAASRRLIDGLATGRRS